MITETRYPFAGSVVLIAGGGAGIGQAVTRGFLEQGARVAVLARDAQSLDETIEGYDAEHALAMAVDVTDRAALADAIARTIIAFGRIDVVIANAGTSEPSDIDTYSASDWDRMRAVNVDAVFSLAQLTVPHLRATRGNLVVVSSIAGLRGDWGMFAYNATKGAINAFVQSLALDLGADGVRVNAVAPAFTVSRLTRVRLDDAAFLDRLLDRVALGRIAEPADIARAVLFLASPDAGYITGAILPVDGGTTASSGTPRPISV